MEVSTQKEKVYLTVPHKNGSVTFEVARYGLLHGELGFTSDHLKDKGLRGPNSPEVISLIYDAYNNPKGRYESKIITTLTEGKFFEFTGNLYLPKSGEEVSGGIIVEYNPRIKNNVLFTADGDHGKLVMKKKSLVKRLHNGDSDVKFVPFGFKTGDLNGDNLRKHPYLIARYEEEGVEKLVEILSKSGKRPFLGVHDSVDGVMAEVSILGRTWGFEGQLDIITSDLYSRGSSIGVHKD